jgi:ZIP family zinc transporter
MTTALLFALLPAAGNFVGGLIAEVLPASSAWRNWTLHAAVGVVLAVVSVEIIPEALTTLAGWQIAVAFAAGGLFYLAIDAIVASRARANRSKMWMIYIAVAADLFGDGLMIGTSSTLTADLALVLAIGQVLADVPEGAASILTFRANDINRRRRLLLSASFAIPALAGAALSYALLRDRPESWQLMGLVGTAGLFSVAVIEDMISDAHEAEPDTRTSTLALLAGFAAFVLVSAGLG